jgi:hypothetical protein
MKRLTSVVAFALACVAAIASKPAAAQTMDLPPPPERRWISPERFTIELRIGPYSPSMGGNDAFKQFFNGDSGPLLAAELDVIAYRIKDILYLSGGGGIGTAVYSGHTIDLAGMPTSEETSLNLLPLNLLAVARFDALPRKLGIPFILTGKLGYQWMHWKTDSGGTDTHDGWSIGVLWAGQIALDLDTFDHRAARTMDEEWGINHSFVYLELFGFEPSGKSLPVGDRTWCTGLGFVF